MSRFLFVAYQGFGHILPMLTLAKAVQARGHWVGVYCAAEHGEHVTAHGVPYCAPRVWQGTASVPRSLRDDLWAGRDVLYKFEQYKMLGLVEWMVEDIEYYVAEHEVAVIVQDVLMPGGGLAAERVGLPWASITMSPLPIVETHRYMTNDEFWFKFDNTKTRQALGLPPSPGNLLDRFSPLLHLVPATPEFVGDTEALPPQVRCIGPLSSPEPATPPTVLDYLRDAPAPILVTLSSERPSNFKRTDADVKRYLRAVIDGLADEPVTAIITTSAFQQGLELGPLPANIHVDGFVAHEALMPYLHAAIVHGGWGGLGRVLRYGLPMVLVPFGLDQPRNAARCAELGFGINLALATITAEEVRVSVRTILRDAQYRTQVQHEAARIRALDPPQQAATLLEALVAHRPHAHSGDMAGV